MMIKINTIFQNLVSLCTTFWIIATEYIKYSFYVYGSYREFIENLARRISRKNILYVKVFQSIALNKSIIDDEINQILVRYTDHAPYEEEDIDYYILEHVIKDHNLVSIGPIIPINSGMISLVYKMKNKQGMDIIIKMKRTNIKSKLEKAIKEILFFVDIISFMPMFNLLELPSMVDKNIQIILQQTDFLQEIKNMDIMRESCKYLKYVKIPDVYADKKYPDVIIMEFLDGYNIQELDENDYDGFAKLVLKYGFFSMTVSGVAHGDLHSGNIIFLKKKTQLESGEYEYDYRLGLIDLGIVLLIDEDIRISLMEIFCDLFESPLIESSKKFLNDVVFEKDILNQLPVADYNNVLGITMDALSSLLDDDSKELDQMKLFESIKEITNYLNDHNLTSYGLKPRDCFVKMQLVMAMSHSVTIMLCKNNYREISKKVVKEMFMMG